MKKTDGDSIPFSIEFVTCDEKNNNGGEVIVLNNAVLVGGFSSKSVSRNPNHYQNFTRNITAAGSMAIRKINIWLVIKFNGMEVQI